MVVRVDRPFDSFVSITHDAFNLINIGPMAGLAYSYETNAGIRT